MRTRRRLYMKNTNRLFNVIIVDDEPLAIEGLLLNIRWEKYGFNVVETFEQSELALEYMANKDIDLLITDVRMPGIDGIELIKQIKKLKPQLNILIMSGHRDFAYVKSAMVNGATNYLVKPVFEEDLFPILIEIRETIRLKEQESYYDEVYLQEALKQYVTLYNPLNLEQYSTLSNYYEHSVTTQDWVILSCWRGYEPIEGKIVLNMMETVTNEIILLYSSAHYIISFVQAAAIYLEVELENQKYIHKWEIHNAPKNLISLRTIYAQMCQKWDYIHHYNGQLGTIVVLEEESDLIQLHLEKITNQFLETINRQDKIKVVFLLQKVIVSLEINKSSLGAIYKFFVALYGAVVASFSKELASNIQIGDLFEITLSENKYSFEEILVFFETKIMKLIECISQTRAPRKDPFKCQIESYIDEHVTENLTIKELSEYVHMHPTYLGQKLNQLWGESFTSYVHRVRIRKSILLINGIDEEHLQEIAYKLGYHHYPVFLKYFKKYMGMTPKEFLKSKKIH